MSDLLLGYAFTYKSSEVADGQLRLTFHRGVSRDYPREFKNERDFDSVAVYAGDFSPIAISDQELRELFYQVRKGLDPEWMKEIWESDYQGLCTLEDYLRFRSVIGTELELSMRRIQRYNDAKLLVWANLGIETHQALKDASIEIYHRQIRDALG